VARRCAPMASSPRILNRPTDRHRPDAQAMPKTRLAVHHRAARSGLKALRNTSAARRQAAKLCYRFDPLTPSARSANLFAGDGTKNSVPAPNKEPKTTRNDRLTEKPHTGSNLVSSSAESAAKLTPDQGANRISGAGPARLRQRIARPLRRPGCDDPRFPTRRS
jgi:hypothetical protein